MKTIKKILALALALVMVLGISSVAFADGTALSGGTADATADATDLKTNGITMTVEYKPEEGLKAPAKTFSYSVTVPADDDLTASPKIYKGLGSITIADVAWTANEATEDANNTKTVAIPLSNVGPFTHAGIYRYYITQAAFSADEVDAGILTEKGNGQAVTKVLDLAVNTAGEITSAVLSEDGAHTTFDYTEKTDGFKNTFGKKGDDDGPDGPGDPQNSGKHTITLSKVIAGTAADSSEEFPFSVKVSSDNSVLAGVEYSIGTKADAVIGEGYDDVVKLKGGQTIDIVVPNDVKVEIKELTAATEGYSITSAQTGFDDGATVQTAAATTDAGFEGTLDNANDTATVTYTNTRDDISFTGVALKVAPFAMILAAGCLMLVIGKRRKESEEA